MSAKFWGKHLLIDAANCDRDLIKSESNIKAFITILLERIDMVAHGDPILEHFATHDPEKGGYTFCQMITTSLVDGHLVDHTGDAYISVHSCKDFDDTVVIDTIKQFFRPTSVTSTVILRKA